MKTGKKTGVELLEMLPDVNTYQQFKRLVGWSCTSDAMALEGLRNSLYSVCALRKKQVLGFGRLVGDGHIYFYLQDIIVHPDHQGQGIGDNLVRALLGYIGDHAAENAFIGLMAASGSATFYERYGFKKRDDNAPGMGKLWKTPGLITVQH